MKKLMIAAAAAAMIGGVQAAASYTLETSLHTTAGEPGVDIYTPDYANLGRNATGMWYNDAALTNECNIAADGTRTWKDPAKYPNLSWTWGTSYNGVAYPKFVIKTYDLSAEYGDDNKAVPMLTEDAEIALLRRLRLTYNQQSYGFWCGEYKWWTKTDKVCYRVWAPGEFNESWVRINDDCCADGVRNFVSANGPCIIFDTNTVAGAVFNRFGAQTADADTLAYEIYAQVTNLTMKGSNLAFNGFLAGQGYRENGDAFPEEIHGSIVGYTEAPSCPDCCLEELPKAVAFECNWSTTPDASLRTAVYGTFRMYR